VLGKFVRTIYAGALVSLAAAHSEPAAACRGVNEGPLSASMLADRGPISRKVRDSNSWYGVTAH
jgi:hypothetical protein